MDETDSDELSDAEIDALRMRTFSTFEEAMAASHEILARFGDDPRVMARFNNPPVNVPFEL